MNSTDNPQLDKTGAPYRNSNSEQQDAHERPPPEETDAFIVKKSSNNTYARRPSYREPVTHVKNRSLFELLFGSCFGDSRTQLTVDELVPFYEIKADANNYFDNKYTGYDDIFREMWRILTGGQLEEVENEGWKKYGFQNQNPRSDFRGGGLLSLKQLMYFIKNNPQEIPEMSNEANSFLFAVSSINITYFLIKYYHLSEHLIYSKDKNEICSRVALKSFCSLLLRDENIMDKIHGLLLNDLYSTWQILRQRIPRLNLLDFNLALNVIKDKYMKATKDHIFDDFATLKRYYLKKEVKLPSKRQSFS